MHKNRLHLLYFTPEQWPTFRPDIVALFGKYLPRHGIAIDLVTGCNIDEEVGMLMPWGGGEAILCNLPGNRVGQYLIKFLHNLRVLITFNSQKYDVIQVRDMTLTALVGIIIAKVKGVQFFYWLSFPMSEAYIERARAIGFKGGVRFWLPLIQGTFGKWLLYRVVLPRADHVFVQSHQMQIDLAKKGISMSKMTPVPMGVDTEISSPESIKPSDDSRLKGKRVLVYLGTLDRVRQVEIIFQMLAIIKHQVPNILLILVGDTDDALHRDWLKQEVIKMDIVDNVIWTGWLPSQQAWSYVRSAEIGLSPFPRSYLLDSASPTKMLEYMAFGLPVIVNDNPDQAKVIKDSGAGICVKLEPFIFAESVIRLLSDQRLCHEMGHSGQQYVTRIRAYDFLASSLAVKYRKLYSGSR